ncbi:MAG: replicative DNA helicase [Clostridia bacterium]|nr:replicative DNA helicase [Clostridia bacterium]
MEGYIGANVYPHSLEAEQSVIGAMLTDADSVAVAFESLNEDDFYRPENKEIFAAMVQLFEKDVPIDVVTVCDMLSQRGTVDAVGGSEFVVNLSIGVSVTANLKYYIDIIKGKSLLRKLINASSEIQTEAYEGVNPPETVAENAEKLIFDILTGKNSKGFSEIDEVVARALEKLQELQNKGSRITGLETGFANLDMLLSGFQKSTLNILAARPGVGKTSFALNIARFVAVQKKVPVAVFSLEMSDEEILNRVLSSQALVDSYKLKTGNLDADDWSRIMQAVPAISDAPLYIDDTAALTVTEIRSKCRRLKLEKGLGLVVVDYLQLMNPKGKIESRQQAVSEMSRALKILAKELEVPVLCLSQLSRSIESRTDKTPVLSDLRESGAIEQDADVVMFLGKRNEDEEGDGNNMVDLIVAKHRSGSTGKMGLMWKPQYTTFMSVDTTHEEY